LDEPALQALMIRSQDGDARAHRELLAALAPRLRAFFRAKGASAQDGEDLVQETLIAVHVKRHLHEPGRPVMAWVHAIARHRLIDRWRHAGRRGVHEPLDDHAPHLAAESHEAGDPTRDVERLLATLPDKQRRSIELVKLGEASIAEAASLTGWSQSDVKISIHRGLKALMARMAEPAPAAAGAVPALPLRGGAS
jgi:RNA polymerase sigma-70 factor (ECF subfamily)